jgi:calcium-dependent protein kinase
LLFVDAKSHILFRKAIIKKIREGKVTFDGKAWKSVSDDAKNFVSSLLKLDPAKRMTARAAAQHPFITRSMRLSILSPAPELSRKVKSNLVRYADSTDFKKVALLVIARKMSTEEILDLRGVFAEFDTSNDGTISFDEFKKALSRSHYTEHELEHAFRSIVSGLC